PSATARRPGDALLRGTCGNMGSLLMVREDIDAIECMQTTVCIQLTYPAPFSIANDRLQSYDDLMENKDLHARPLRSQPTRDRILEAAKRIFARDGYDRATIRAIAAEADINPAMVMRYYGSKDGLFTAVTDYRPKAEAAQAFASAPRSQLGEVLVRAALDAWDSPETGPTQPAVFRAALSGDVAREKFAQQYQRGFIALLKVIGTSNEAQEARALIGTQLIGLLVARYILRVPRVAAMPRETLIRDIGRSIQSYIDQVPEQEG